FDDAFAKSGTPGDRPPLASCFADADDGLLWVGTDGGVALFDPGRRTARFLPAGADGSAGLPRAPTRALLRSRDGSLWIGTFGKGLIRYDPAAGTVVQSYRREGGDGARPGLGSDNVLALLEDRDGGIWAGTGAGLNRIDPQSQAVRL